MNYKVTKLQLSISFQLKVVCALQCQAQLLLFKKA